MQSIGPVTISPTSPIRQQVTTIPGIALGVRVANESPWLLTYTCGRYSRTINPWNVDRMPILPTEVGFTLTADSVDPTLQAQPPAPPSSTVMMEVATVNDAADFLSAFPGSYPQQLTRQSATFGIPKLLTTLASANGVTSVNITPPFGTLSLFILVDDTTKVQFIKVVGVQTGIIYANYGTLTHNPGGARIALDVDQSYQIQATGSAGGAIVYILADPTLEFVSIQDIIGAPNVRLVDFFSGGFVNSIIRRAQTALEVTLERGTPQATYDWFATGTFSGAGTPSVTQAAPGAGLELEVAYVSGTVLTIAGGGAATPQLQLTRGTFIKRHWMNVAAGGAKDEFELTGLGYGSTDNTGITWQWDRAIAANQFATLDVAGYIVKS